MTLMDRLLYERPICLGGMAQGLKAEGIKVFTWTFWNVLSS